MAMAMPNDVMACFKLQLKGAIVRYWWSGKKSGKHGMHWVSWMRMKKCKQQTGLGFKDLRCFNLAMTV